MDGFDVPVFRGSVLQGLWTVQAETCCYKREQICCRMLRNLVLHPNSKFTPVWKKDSTKPMDIGSDRRTYFDSYVQCYYHDGIGGVPRLQYNLEDMGFRSNPFYKIQAILLYHCHIMTCPSTSQEKEACLLVLTADGFLKVLSADRGVVLCSVFLSTIIKYRYLNWADYLHTVQVKSTNDSNRLMGRAVPSNTSIVFTLFSIHPLNFIACFAVDEQIFGKGMVDANVSQDLLIVTHKNGVVNIYSLAWILKKAKVMDAPLGKLVQIQDEAGGVPRVGVVGEEGFGIPYTVKITECPPLLFSTKSGRQMGVSFGGSPTVFMHSAPRNLNEFKIKILNTQKQEQIAVLQTNSSSMHHDVAEFHFDDYRRVLHISRSTLSCHRLISDRWKDTTTLKCEYSINFESFVHRDDRDFSYTSSGRVVRTPVYRENDEDLFVSAVQDVDFENELDLLYAVVTLPDPSTEENFQCNLYFIDESNGSILKKIPLPTWEQDKFNSLYYELDCILHLVRRTVGGAFRCHYYRLFT